MFISAAFASTMNALQRILIYMRFLQDTNRREHYTKLLANFRTYE